MKNSEESICVVTGAASGIGRATAQRIAAEGVLVYCCDMDMAGAERTVSSILEAGNQARAYLLDVSSAEGWAGLAEHLTEQGASVIGLINNAGLVRDRSMLKMTEEQWDLVIDVNLKGAWLGCRSMIPLMPEGAGIVNLSSESRNGNFGQSNYAAAKAGIVGLTKTVAIEQARRGIRCNAIAPGTVETPMTARVPEEVRASWIGSIPLGRFGAPEELAEAIWFLVSPSSSYITGQVLNVDGGSA